MQRGARARDAWLTETAAVLDADRRVLGWGLVGSFGRGDADDWSDLDVMVVVDDDDFDVFASLDTNPYWSTADWCEDARRNAPVGATVVGCLFVRDGLPLRVDWYVYPRSQAAWPRDCAVRKDAHAITPVDLPFAVWNAQGACNAPLPVSTAEAEQHLLSLVPIAAKYVARRAPDATPMIERLGVSAPGTDPLDQIAAIRARLATLGTTAPDRLVAAIHAHLDLVEATIADGPNAKK